MNKKIFYTLFSLCFVFSISGAFNEGFSRFFFAIPFYIVFFILIKKDKAELTYKLIALATIIFSISWSLTLTRNHLMYPILSNGTIEILEDGLIKSYQDKSAIFIVSKGDETGCTGCGQIEYTEVHRGETIAVEGINLNHPDFKISRNLITKYGNLNGDSKHYKLSHPLVSPLHQLGVLMYYPIVPLYIKSMVSP